MFHTRGPGAHLPGGGHVTADPSGDSFMQIVALAIGADIMKNILAQGGELETQKKLLVDKLGNRGTDADVQGAVAAAIRYSTGGADGVIGTTPAENLKGIRELMSVTPTLADAEALYGPMMRVSKALEELSGGAKKADETMPLLAKALENLGGGIDPITHKLDPARMQRATDEALKTIIAGGGFIDAQSLFGLAKQAGGMGRLSEPGKLFDEVITSLIDMGGPRTGTALAATGRQFLGDKMTVQTAQELTDLGLLPEGGWKKAGGTGITMNPGVDIKGVDEIKDGRIADWFLDTVGPAIEAKYGEHMTTADLIQESSKMFGQQTGQRLALMFLANEAQRQRDVAIKNGVDPQGVYQGIVDKDFAANLGNLGSAIKGFAEIVGSANIPAAIYGLHLLSDAIHGLTDLAAKIPTAAQIADNPVAHFDEAAGAAVWDWIKGFDSAIHGKFWGTGAQAAPLPDIGRPIVGRDPRSPSTGTLAYIPPAAPPVVNVAPTALNVSVFVDGEIVAHAMEQSIERNNRTTSSSYDHDGRAGFAGPDVRD
jgi:hypothetical protein